MDDCKREVKHLLLAKFKEDISEDEIEECIKEFPKLVALFPSIKSFEWGKEKSIANYHQGFTHVFESTFESAQDVADFLSHPHHTDFANILLPKLEKFAALDFEPTKAK